MSGLRKLRLDDSERQPRRVSTWPLVVLLVLVVAGALAVAVFFGSTDLGDQSVVQAAVGPRGTQEAAPAARPRREGEAVAAGGYVEARRRAVVFPGRDGVAVRVHVELGQQVAEGDLLVELEGGVEAAELEMSRAELSLAQARLRKVASGARREEVRAADAEALAAEAQRDEAQQTLDRLERLLEHGATAAADVERARRRTEAAEARLSARQAQERLLRGGSRPADVLAARAQVERAEAALRMAQARVGLGRGRAPFTGTVVALDVVEGEVVSAQAGRGGVEVADLSELWVRVDVPEMRIARVHLGARVEVVVDALGRDAEPLAGRVVEIGPVADRRSNTIEVAIRIEEPPPMVRPNLSARVSIQNRETEEVAP